MKILLLGNPNVGKSVIFSRLTGTKVIVSNYPGTTVEFTKGFIKISDFKAEIIDAPGSYTLTPTNKAEEVAVKLIKEADIIINVIDATNLERNLLLTLEIIKNIKKPLVIALNMWDETKHKGIKIDVEKLKKILDVEVVATCGLSGEGIKELVFKLKEAKISSLNLENKDIWKFIGEIITSVQKLSHRHHTFFDFLQEISVKPPWAYAVALGVILVSFFIIRFIGESLINYIFDPFFEYFYSPLILRLSSFIKSNNFLHSILIGDVREGLNYTISFGLLTTGIYVPLAMVLPYVFSFYLILSILEDIGYLPRLAVLCDRLFHKLGLHGYAIVPTILGLGCNVPGALSTRLFEAKREKFIAATLLAISIPCMAQIAMIVGVLGKFGIKYVAIVFLSLGFLWVILGLLLNKFLAGESPEILLEIPPYRRISPEALFKKLWIRLNWFFKEAIPYVLLGVLIVNILYYFKIIDFLAKIFSPLMKKIWGLPPEAISALLIGFLRKDVAVGMLSPLNLTVKQLMIGCIILAVYFPCVATFVVLMRELGIKDMFKSVFLMIIVAIIVGAVANIIFSLVGIP